MSEAGLTSGELSDMRSAAETYLPDTCTIQTYTEAANDIGEVVETWANTYTGVSCRLGPGGGNVEVEVAGRLVSTTTFALTLSQSQAIDPKNRVVLGGETYYVVGEDTGKSNSITRRVEVIRA